LHDTVEHGDFCVGSGQQFAVDIDIDVLISRVRGLQLYSPVPARMACTYNLSYQGLHSASNGSSVSGKSPFAT